MKSFTYMYKADIYIYTYIYIHIYMVPPQSPWFGELEMRFFVCFSFMPFLPLDFVTQLGGGHMYAYIYI